MVQRVAGCIEGFGRFFEFRFKACDRGLGVRELRTELLECNFKIPIFFFVFVYKVECEPST